jgi:hypothetical protein
LARYAALVSCCDSADFGPHRLLTDRKILYRIPDHQAFALAQYIYALEPPKNPNLSDPRAAAGKQIFDREGCANCHTPPLYTNNKLTPARGYSRIATLTAVERCRRFISIGGCFDRLPSVRRVGGGYSGGRLAARAGVGVR